MQMIYGDPEYTYCLVPVDQGLYDTTIADKSSAMVWSQAEHIHDGLNDNILIYDGVCLDTNDLIIYASGEDAVALLRKRYIGFGDTNPQQMIEHLHPNVCIKMNTKEKDAFKTQGYACEWDMTKNIITYFKEIRNFK